MIGHLQNGSEFSNVGFKHCLWLSIAFLPLDKSVYVDASAAEQAAESAQAAAAAAAARSTQHQRRRRRLHQEAREKKTEKVFHFLIQRSPPAVLMVRARGSKTLGMRQRQAVSGAASRRS